MFTPFFTDVDVFQASQNRHMNDIRVEVEQLRLAEASQPPKHAPRFRIILTSIAGLFFGV